MLIGVNGETHMSYNIVCTTTTTTTTRRFAQARVALCREETVFYVRTQAVASLLMAARDVGGGTASARRWRERRQRSWRHEQLSVAAALASARHHSAAPGVVSRHEAQQHEVEQDTYDGLRAQNTPPAGSRPGVLQDPGPPWVEAVTVGYVAAGAPSLVVAPVAAHDELDTAFVQYLLQQSLLARAEEEEAREQEEDKRREEAVVTRMQRLEAEVMKYAGRDRSQLQEEEGEEEEKAEDEKTSRAPRPRCRRPCDHQRQVPAVRIPVVTQRQVPTVHLFMLPVQFLDKVLDMPVVVQ